MMDFEDEMLQHRFGNFKIRYDTVPHRPYGLYVVGGAPQHFLGIGAHRYDPWASLQIGFNSDDGRFGKYDPFTPHIHKRVGRAKVNGHVVGENS
jgi:hypothetical protein